jgi:hypothetical protein
MRRLVTSVPVALVVVACATSRELGSDGMPVYRPSEVDRAPRLMGCSGYSPPPVAYIRYSPVTVTFVVAASGFVDPGSIVLTRAPSSDPTAQTRALNIARGCAYQPGVLRAEPVAVRVSTTFRLEPAGSP